MKIQSYSDVITNSSSELFVFNDGETLEEVKNILADVYPNWKNEYYDPIKIEDASEDDIETYADYAFPLYFENEERDYYCKKHGIEYFNYNYEAKYCREFDLNDCYTRKFIEEKFNQKPEDIFEDWEHYNPFCLSLKWKEKDNEEIMKMHWWLNLSEKGLEFFKSHHKGEILLFSEDENPNWEYQEKLMEVAKRYHLG